MSTTAARRPLRVGVDVPLRNKCTVCYERHNDPIIGPLCLGCARIAVAKWGPGMLSTIRGMDERTRELLGVAEDDPAFRARFRVE